MLNLTAVAFVVQFASTFLPIVYRRIFFALIFIVIFVTLIAFFINRQLESVSELFVIISAMSWANIIAWLYIQYRAGATSLSYKNPNSTLNILAGVGLLLIAAFQFGLAFGQNISGKLSLIEQSFSTLHWGIVFFSIGAHNIAFGLFKYSFRVKGIAIFGFGLIDWALVESYAWRDTLQGVLLQLLLRKRFIFSRTISILIPLSDKEVTERILIEKIKGVSNEPQPLLGTS